VFEVALIDVSRAFGVPLLWDLARGFFGCSASLFLTN
jgi:hypothetical protein